jgi:hypothetical protein
MVKQIPAHPCLFMAVTGLNPPRVISDQRSQPPRGPRPYLFNPDLITSQLQKFLEGHFSSQKKQGCESMKNSSYAIFVAIFFCVKKFIYDDATRAVRSNRFRFDFRVTKCRNISIRFWFDIDSIQNTIRFDRKFIFVSSYEKNITIVKLANLQRANRHNARNNWQN